MPWRAARPEDRAVHFRAVEHLHCARMPVRCSNIHGPKRSPTKHRRLPTTQGKTRRAKNKAPHCQPNVVRENTCKVGARARRKKAMCYKIVRECPEAVRSRATLLNTPSDTTPHPNALPVQNHFDLSGGTSQTTHGSTTTGH